MVKSQNSEKKRKRGKEEKRKKEGRGKVQLRSPYGCLYVADNPRTQCDSPAVHAEGTQEAKIGGGEGARGAIVSKSLT
jgi:hypothetical protein